MKKLSVILFIIFSFVAVQVSAAKRTSTVAKSDLSGEQVAQIDIPQNDLTILFSLNFTDGDNCIVKCRWTGGNGKTVEESGKARYALENNQLIIDFPNEEERIRTDNIFDMHNVYDVKKVDGRLVIYNSPQFRNNDVIFGKGYAKRGFSKIIFSHDD